MRVALVNLFEFDVINTRLGKGDPNASRNAPPIGLLTLAAILEQKGHQVDLVDFVDPVVRGDLPLDANLPRAAAEYVRQLPVDVVGFTSRCDCYHYTLEMMRHFRELEPDRPIVLGGPQATITASATMASFPFVDILVRHEGDRTLPHLVEVLEDGRRLDEVPGISFRRDGKIFTNPDAERIKDLDEIPVPAYHLLPPEDGVAHIEVGRGCPFRCTFCSTSLFFARTFRLKSAQRIVEEVALLQKDFGIHRVHFIHDMFTVNLKKVREVCERLIEADLGVTWGCSARIDCVKPWALEVMQKAGCDSIYFGIETGSPRMQKAVKKGLKLEQVLPVLDVCHRLGIRTTASFITGFPEETREDVEHTLRMILECSCTGVDVTQLHLFSPLPGTPILEDIGDRLVFTGYVSDASAVDAPRDPYYDRLIQELPDVFCSYYQAIPKHLDMETIRGVDQFGYTLQRLRHTFFYLLEEQAADDLFDLFLRFKEWLAARGEDLEDRTAGDNLSLRQITGFLADLFARQGERLPASCEAFKYDTSSTELLLHQEIRDSTGRSKREGRDEGGKDPHRDPPLRAGGPDDVPMLAKSCVLTDFRCDINQLTRRVQRLEAEGLSLASRPQPSAVLLHTSPRRRWTARVIPLNEWMVALLDRCDGQTRLADIADEVWERGRLPARSRDQVQRMCLRALRRLVNEGLVGLQPDETPVSGQLLRVEIPAPAGEPQPMVM